MGHVLVISADPEDPDDFDFEIECDGRGCDLWQECDSGIHLVKADDRYDHGTDDPATEHGQPHAQLDGGWCVSVTGCAYRQTIDFEDEHFDIARLHGTGRWEVDLDWVDWGVGMLLFVGPA